MVQESWLDTVCTTEKLKPRSAIKGTLRGVRGGENSPYSITRISKGPIPDVPVLGGESRRVGDNAPILQLQMMLRTRFGLILNITERMKSYPIHLS